MPAFACVSPHAGSHGHMSAAERRTANRLSRPLVNFEQVPVHVLGDGDAGMPEHLGDHAVACPGPASTTPPSGAAYGNLGPCEENGG